MNLNDVVAKKCQPPVGCNNLAILIQICLWHLLNQCRICSTKWLTLVPWKDVDIWILKVCPRAHVFPFDSKVLALRRGIMQIDHFASHHGCWLGWYSGWSNSRLGVGQRSRKQCSFIRLKCLHPSRDSLQRLVFEAAPDGDDDFTFAQPL